HSLCPRPAPGRRQLAKLVDRSPSHRHLDACSILGYSRPSCRLPLGIAVKAEPLVRSVEQRGSHAGSKRDCMLNTEMPHRSTMAEEGGTLTGRTRKNPQPGRL